MDDEPVLMIKIFVDTDNIKRNSTQKTDKYPVMNVMYDSGEIVQCRAVKGPGFDLVYRPENFMRTEFGAPRVWIETEGPVELIEWK